MKKTKIVAVATSAIMMAGMFLIMPKSENMMNAKADLIFDNFELNYDGWTNYGDQTKIEATKEAAYNSERGMKVTNRLTKEDGVYSEKGFYIEGGQDYDYSVWVRNDSDKTETFRLSLSYVFIKDESSEKVELVSKEVPAGEWVELKTKYKAPDDTVNLTLKINTDSTSDFSFDDVNVVGKNVINLNAVKAAVSNPGLKDYYANYFRVGTAISPGVLSNSTINAMILKEYNSITHENEMKPDATLVQSGSSNTDIKVSLSRAASVIDFCTKNNIALRGHTLVWHSQTPEWFFKDNFSTSGNWVSTSVMDQRMESYIKNMFSAIKTQYPSLNLYAYDVVNEATSDDSNRTKNYGGAREPGYGNGKSPWVQVYGNNSFIEKAFTYAKKYAPSSCKLFYNDYNEYWDHKRDSIATMASGLYKKGVLDGIGMQSHINADMSGFTGIDTYKTALAKYAAIGCNVQITELDISTENGKFTLQQQADKYKAIFQAAMNTKNVTAVCVWGPNDANTWIGSENAPLLFNSNNQAKPAYTTLATLVPESQWGDGKNPGGSGGTVTTIEPDANGYYFHSTFENASEPTDGWASRGEAEVLNSGAVAQAGTKSLLVRNRTATWNGTQYAISDYFAGKSLSFSGCVRSNIASPNFYMSLQYTDAADETKYMHIAEAKTAMGNWVQLKNTNFTIPSDAKNIFVYFETTEGTDDFYVDEVIMATQGKVINGPVPVQETTTTVVTTTTKPNSSILFGDITSDGNINNGDLVSISQYLIGDSNLTGNSLLAADVTGDGKIDVADLALMKQYLMGDNVKLGKVTETPIETTKVSETTTTAVQTTKASETTTTTAITVNNDEMKKKFDSLTLTKGFKNAINNNPIYTQRFGADPGVMEYNGRIYVYMTNDAFTYDSAGKLVDCNYSTIKTLNVLSSDDLVNWTDHGIIKTAGSDGAAKWASNSWAPAAAHKTINGKEKFFLYFANNASGIGVLTSDSPTGPWTDPLGKALVSRSTPNANVTWLFDPAVFIDTDGTGYLYFGGGVPEGQNANPKTARVVKLGADMISLSGTAQLIDAPYIFEDSGMNKIGNTYYYSYCSNWNTGGNTLGLSNAAICYMTSSSPMGPFTYKGVMFPNVGGGEFGNYNNNHHTLIQFKNEYYLFYHARATATAMGYSFNYRTTQVDKATVSNGNITVKATMSGVAPVQTLNPFVTVQAETIHNQGGLTVNNNGTSGNTYVSAKSGNWLGLKNVNFSKDATKVSVKVSSTTGGAIKICTGGPTGTVVGYVDVPSTGGSMKDITASISGLSGTKDLYFVFYNSMEFDSWIFS